MSAPLRRQPAVRDFLLLVEVLSDDFPRRPTAELLASPRIRWECLLDGSDRPWGERADAWSRQARIVGGLEEWTGDLVRWAAEPRTYAGQSEEARVDAERRAEERSRRVGDLAGMLAALRSRVSEEPERWSRHAESLRGLIDELLGQPADTHAAEALDDVRELLDEMGRLETLVGDDRVIRFDEVRAWLVDAVQGSEPPLRRQDDGGFRVLDAMQLRGLTFRHVHFLGLNSGLFPRRPREHPVLGDGPRSRLAESTGRPLPLASEGMHEERLLLSMVVGSARERVDVSWQRADEAGKAKTPSIALREIARLAYGRPDVEKLHAVERHLPSHPQQWLAELAQDPGLVTPEGAMILEALQPETPQSLGQRYPVLAVGLEMLRATQSFTMRDASYDARIGPPEAGLQASVSALETLGRCPLQYFFKHVLRVRELEDETDILDMPARDLGLYAHDVLETIYAKLLDEGRFEGDPDMLVQRGVELLRKEHPNLLGRVGERLERRLPVLGRQLSRSWHAAVESFLKRDLARLADKGQRPGSLEVLMEVPLDFNAGVTQEVRGRFDRRLDGEPATVGDYKTSGRLESRIKISEFLRGQRLQVALYWMMAGERDPVELLGVGPDYRYDDDGDYRVKFDGLDGPQSQGFRETMRVLLELVREGRFPFRRGTHCEWCAWEQACRRTHPPTQDRQELARDTADYLLLSKKTMKKPRLAQWRQES